MQDFLQWFGTAKKPSTPSRFRIVKNRWDCPLCLPSDKIKDITTYYHSHNYE